LVSRLRELSRRLLDVEEAERRSINRELHDRIGQNLSALLLTLDRIRSRIPEDPSGVLRGRIDDARNLLEATIAQVRNVMAELHPPALDEFGLFAALRAHAEAFSAQIGTPIALHGEDLVPRLSRAVEISLFRIAQEALSNAAKHAHATRIEVTLVNSPARATLTIADDGAGFDTGRSKTGSWGLTIMRERAAAAGIVLHIESEAGRGTRVVGEAIRESA
jgi:two-component system sensor histidine kinase UhpB